MGDNICLLRDDLEVATSLECWSSFFRSGKAAEVLKVNGSLCAPFRITQTVLWGCALSRMLYVLAPAPLNMLVWLNLFLPGCNSNVPYGLSFWCFFCLWPSDLLFQIQANLICFFWSSYHWVLQSVLGSSRDEEGDKALSTWPVCSEVPHKTSCIGMWPAAESSS